MEIIEVKSLAPAETLDKDYYDPQTGQKILKKKTELTEKALSLLEQCGVKELAVTSPKETPAQLLKQIRFRGIEVNKIPPGTVLAFDVYAPDGSLLLSKGTELSKAAIDRMSERGIHTLYVRKTPDPEHTKRVKAAIAALESGSIPPAGGGGSAPAELPKLEEVKFKQTEMISDTKNLSVDRVDKIVSTMEGSNQLQVRIEPKESLSNQIKEVNALVERDPEMKQKYTNIYEHLVQKTQVIFDHMRASDSINGDMVIDLCDQVVAALVADRELLLCSLYINVDGAEYLSQHAVNVTVLSVNIAAQHGFSHKQVMEVGYGALLADVGMLKIPDKIRFKQGPLTTSEQLEIMRHTLYGIDLLQNVSAFPKTVPLVAFQSHERIDGSGYPHGKSGYGIHDYAKIVSIADVYHAQVAKRPFRETSRLPYKAIEEVLQMSSSKKLDNAFTKDLLLTTSLFPIGSYVQLNSGERARVLGSNAQLFTKPKVAILYDTENNLCTPRRLCLAESENLQVVSPVAVENPDPLAGF